MTAETICTGLLKKVAPSVNIFTIEDIWIMFAASLFWGKGLHYSEKFQMFPYRRLLGGGN